MKSLVIVGAGGVGGFVAEELRTVSDWRSRWHVLGFVDANPSLQGTEIHGLPVLGPVQAVRTMGVDAVVIAVATPAAKREALAQVGGGQGFEFPSLVHPRAWVARSVAVGRGVIVYPGASVNYNAVIGDFVTINMGCAIGHDVRLHSYATLAPLGALAGHSVLEEGVDFGIGACTIQNCSVGQWSRVGAGAVVVRDVPEHVTVVGVPARVLKRLDEP